VPRNAILAVNSGSSSIKFAVHQGDQVHVAGHLEGQALADRGGALRGLIESLRSGGHLQSLAAVGYRIVHGGPRFLEPVRIDAQILATLRSLIPLAPDHLPDQIDAIERIGALLPDTPSVACFDTAFHRTMPRHAQVYGLNRALEAEGVIRYGFHGISYAYIVDKLREQDILPERLIVAHLGNGASMAAIRDGESIDTSMGFTPSGGFLMSTRSGDLDPGILIHLLREKKMSLDAVADLVNKTGGLLGISGVSASMQTLEKESPQTVEVFCYQVKKFLGAYIAALGGLDALVFTGGIGENSATVRQGVCDGLEHLGIVLDPALNLANDPIISTAQSSVAIRVLKTNEELMIARQTLKVIENAPGI
jgi:acetate kinase